MAAPMEGGLNNPFQKFNWYFTAAQLEETPSRRDGISQAEEKEQRKIACGFIQDAGMKLKMPQYTIATAIVYFHRFYMRHSFKHFDAKLVGTACMFLAGKAEETPRKLKDAVSMGYQLKYPDRPALKADSEEMSKRQDQIVNVEREVLKAILFNMKVEHPYQDLIKTVKQMKGRRELAQVAWNLVNDSLRTTICLRFKPKDVAIASIYLASKMIDKPVELGSVPNLHVEELEEIGNQILDLYDSKFPKPVAPCMDAGATDGRSEELQTSGSTLKTSNVGTSLPAVPPKRPAPPNIKPAPPRGPSKPAPPPAPPRQKPCDRGDAEPPRAPPSAAQKPPPPARPHTTEATPEITPPQSADVQAISPSSSPSRGQKRPREELSQT